MMFCEDQTPSCAETSRLFCFNTLQRVQHIKRCDECDWRTLVYRALFGANKDAGSDWSRAKGSDESERRIEAIVYGWPSDSEGQFCEMMQARRRIETQKCMIEWS